MVTASAAATRSEPSTVTITAGGTSTPANLVVTDGAPADNPTRIGRTIMGTTTWSGAGELILWNDAIVHNQAGRSLDLPFLLARDYWAGFNGRVSGLYRPLTTLSFAREFSA